MVIIYCEITHCHLLSTNCQVNWQITSADCRKIGRKFFLSEMCREERVACQSVLKICFKLSN